MSAYLQPQHLAAEARAARLLASEPLQRVRAQVAYLWRLAYGADADAADWTQFDAAMDEYCANYMLKAIASDAQHPAFIGNFLVPGWTRTCMMRLHIENYHRHHTTGILNYTHLR